MAIRPSVPEIITVNSETLQTQIRDLLPSQNGFGSELQASNVITPIIDLTSAAEGSTLPFNLQTAIAYGNATSFRVSNTTTDIATTPGWYRVTGVSAGFMGSSATAINEFIMTDGLTPKSVWQHPVIGNAASPFGGFIEVDLIFAVAAGITLQAKTTNTDKEIAGSIRQIADPDGNLLNPTGLPT